VGRTVGRRRGLGATARLVGRRRRPALVRVRCCPPPSGGGHDRPPRRVRLFRARRGRMLGAARSRASVQSVGGVERHLRIRPVPPLSPPVLLSDLPDSLRIMPRALITGVDGQDGRYLAELLVDKGYETFGMIRGQNNPRGQIVRDEIPAVELIEG